ncbi:tRNA modification GTPase TrmE [Rubidibacter lacunae KORDI 51-2]|uniref:tRNA modification GTPase MnmE n=1 Tax=Rubidibacter lacunae KORDI 51-2 TaxID=582515 RepID=U5DN58_9CHRO|nr:tRNA uridine-5-carboxymethylaminomethyl(34) synthesis GTPase MnmE [Rubidibacter lacunae]ERN42059.1 tRNA modification GTPase TrmE [Rubidibacter lacunae KORDI 51-2]
MSQPEIAQQETIAAIATPVVSQQGSVSIVRLSGATAVAIARALFRAPGRQAWESHRILYGTIRHPDTQAIVDEALLLLMRSPRSYTREDVVEFHCHGGIVPVQQVLQLCVSRGARLAQPGEFTLRAFLNGRIDLTQAESVAELVGAQSVRASQVALAGLQGKLAQPLRQLRAGCLDILAEVEARIDFEDDLPPLDVDAVRDRLTAALHEVTDILATAERGELLRAGLAVAIVGRPNVGKSSLLNAWSRSDRAIVTELPGTTRDVVESQLVVGGIPVRVLDTAGIRDTGDRVEQLGVARSRAAAAAADLVILLVSAADGWTAEDAEIYGSVCDRPLLLVVNKVDLAPPERVRVPAAIAQVVPTVAARQEGIDALETAILSAVQADGIAIANTDIAINQRQAAVLTRAQVSLQHVSEAIAARLPLDFWTIDLRTAIRALGEVTGEDVTESVLERIFSRFCIGK